MNLFQWIAVPLAVLLFIRSAAQLARGRRPRWWLLSTASIWLGAGVAIMWPEATTRVAQLLGIGRGADLVSYVVAIVGTASFFYLWQKCRRLESEVTVMVRRLAIRDAQLERRGGSPELDAPHGVDPTGGPARDE